MPFVSHRGQRIHYTVEGSGPLVVLQHGLFVDGGSWRVGGFADGLVDRYRVAAIDSLGHGGSDKPTDPSLYTQEPRAGDIVAVIDDLGCDRAHLVGHSMGGWMAVGVARHYPRRLASLTVGGWEPVRGSVSALPPDAPGPLSYEQLSGWARATAPELMAWVTPAAEPGLRACWAAMAELDGAAAAVLGAGVPVLLWSGRDDPYRQPIQAFAAAHGLQFLATPGDHMGAVIVHGGESGRGVRAFLEGCSPVQ